MIHLYFGEGKGKTSAAVGLSLRALGWKIPVIFVQFLKSRDSGEIFLLKSLGVCVIRGNPLQKFPSKMTDAEKNESSIACRKMLLDAISICEKIPKNDEKNVRSLFVLDEACAAWNVGEGAREAFSSLVLNPPPFVELVLTGRNPPKIFLENADYSTEFVKKNHPFDFGIRARKGVEF